MKDINTTPTEYKTEQGSEPSTAVFAIIVVHQDGADTTEDGLRKYPLILF